MSERYTTATERALRAFNDFIADWIGPAAQPLLCGVEISATQPVRNAILAIAKTTPSTAAGYLVCRRDTLTCFDRDHRNGLIYTPLSAVFDRLDQAQNVHDGCAKREGNYVICELNEWKP